MSLLEVVAAGAPVLRPLPGIWIVARREWCGVARDECVAVVLAEVSDGFEFGFAQQ